MLHMNIILNLKVGIGDQIPNGLEDYAINGLLLRTFFWTLDTILPFAHLATDLEQMISIIIKVQILTIISVNGLPHLLH